MLFGQPNDVCGIENTLVGGIEDDQSWDAQVYIAADGEYPFYNGLQTLIHQQNY